MQARPTPTFRNNIAKIMAIASFRILVLEYQFCNTNFLEAKIKIKN
jgi:hypothetical protein